MLKLQLFTLIYCIGPRLLVYRSVQYKLGLYIAWWLRVVVTVLNSINVVNTGPVTTSMGVFIIRIKFAIYYFLHFNTVWQVAAPLHLKSAIFDCLVLWVENRKGK